MGLDHNQHPIQLRIHRFLDHLFGFFVEVIRFGLYDLYKVVRLIQFLSTIISIVELMIRWQRHEYDAAKVDL